MFPCTNKVIVRRILTEKIILNEIYKKLSSPELIHDVLQKVEKEIENLYSDIPESIRLKNKELRSEERRLNNFVEFIAEGRSSRTIAKALEASEQRVEILKSEIEGLRETRNKVFQSPSVDWIESRIRNLREILQQNTSQSAQTLRQVLGTINMKATYPESGRPYYVAHSSINAFDVLAVSNKAKDPKKGSDTLRWWARKDSNLRPMDYESTALTD